MQGKARPGLLDNAPVRVTATRRPRIQPRTLVRAEVAGTTTNGVFNRVLFTIPKTLKYGECLYITGEGDGLGGWSPQNSLPLKWNEGDVWGAEIPLPAGEQLEYKYVVRRSAGHGEQTWQPGQNSAVKVPAGSGHRLQVIDDWLGKSRSVVYDDGEIGTPPTGTFDASIELEEAQDSAASTAETAAGQSNDLVGLDEETAFEPSSLSPHAVQMTDAPVPSSNGNFEPAVAQANDSQADGMLVDNVSGRDLDSLTVKDLKDRLKNLGLPISGRKAELIDRLASEKS